LHPVMSPAFWDPVRVTAHVRHRFRRSSPHGRHHHAGLHRSVAQRFWAARCAELGCCIAALGTGPIKACREQVAEFGGAGSCPLIGGGSASPLYAAFWHTALVRYLDFMDNFLAPTETCHTAGGGRASFARDGQERYAVRQPLLLGRVFQNGLIVRVRAYLDSAMVARLFEENPLA
jgi:hypothetical protein